MRRAATIAVPLVVFALATGRLVDPGIAALFLIGVIIAALATQRIDIAAPLAVAFIVLVPVYWGRAIGGAGVAVIPVTIAGAVLLPSVLQALERFRLVAIDVLVASYLVLRTLAFVLNYDSGIGAAVGFTSRIVAGYVVFRVLSLIPALRRRLALAFVCAGALLAIPAAIERFRGNPFFHVVTPHFQAEAWARRETRFGTVRVEGSFGHPIPFAMFLAMVVLIAMALATSSRRRGAVVGYLALAGAAAVTLVNTLSRGPLLALAIALAAWVLVEVRHMRPGRVAALAAMFAVLLAFTPALTLVNALWTASVGDTREAQSAEYRRDVITASFGADQFSLLGKETTGDEEVSRAGAQRVGLKSIDNEYAIVFVAGGLLSLLVFVGIGLEVVRTALRDALDPVDRAWTIALAAAFANLITVALLTQFGDLFWISVAVAASISQESRARLRADQTSAISPSLASTVTVSPSE